MGGRRTCRKALSIDLRVRVLAAVAAGATHREVGERFGVSAASVSRWRHLEREQGDARPKALGGDRRSGRIEAHGQVVMAELGPEKDASIEEIRRSLAEQGLAFGFATIQRFFKRHATTRKKDRPRRGAEPARRPEAQAGLVRRPARSRPAPPRLHRRDWASTNMARRHGRCTIKHGGRFEKNGNICLQRSFFTSTVAPLSSAPCV